MGKFRTLRFSLLIAATVACSSPAFAAELPLGPMPISLKHLPVPPVPGLLDGANPIVVDRQAAIALGKALFWDSNVGSDGMACASCHFHAGADGRSKNQVSPGGQSTPDSEQNFTDATDALPLGPNRLLRANDFPLHQRLDPLADSELIFDTDNVVGSAGTFGGDFKAVTRFSNGIDSCNRNADPVFRVGQNGTRRVTPRNAPTVINAVFNHRSFWDGRANNVFNGSSPWGDRDPDAGVWVKTGAASLEKQRLRLINSSLASLAVAPPTNHTEMGCNKRSMLDLGRKLLLRQPLQNQQVHYLDSALGVYANSDAEKLQPGLNTTYAGLIRKAYNAKYWSYSGTVPLAPPTGQSAYTQLEANFPMFFALAIQLYESTLISDESPFDNSARDANHQPIDLSAAELNGLEQFRKNQCALCHLGPNFSSASIAANAAIAQMHPEAFGEPTFKISASPNVVNRIPLMVGNLPVTAFYDTGFSSNGAAREANDIGAGGVDDFGQPLSFSSQYLQLLAGNTDAVLDRDVNAVRACDFQTALASNLKLPYALPNLFTRVDGLLPQPQSTANCFLPSTNAFIPSPAAAKKELSKPINRRMVAAVTATFKTPSLRNIELTGPYMHNGGMATLEQVVEFYSRGGNFNLDGKHVTRVFLQPNLQFDAQNRADLVAFLKTLTDDRVRYQRAPFDHPALKIPHGHVGDESQTVGGHPLNASLSKDDYLLLPAVGADGANDPLLPFAELIEP
ncbi:MAG: cytochrome c peroxidase [Methylomonas sp.]|nr:cytochrome c peroxidase [Methylomonas sp.]